MNTIQPQKPIKYQRVYKVDTYCTGRAPEGHQFDQHYVVHSNTPLEYVLMFAPGALMVLAFMGLLELLGIHVFGFLFGWMFSIPRRIISVIWAALHYTKMDAVSFWQWIGYNLVHY